MIHAFKEEELLGVIGSTPGQPYSDFGVTTDRDNILALYFNEGFPEASFTATAERVSAGPEAQKEGGGKSETSSQEKGTKAEKEKESRRAIEQEAGTSRHSQGLSRRAAWADRDA